MKRSSIILVMTLLGGCLMVSSVYSASPADAYLAVFDEILATVDEHFYNGEPIPQEFVSKRDSARMQVKEFRFHQDHAAFSATVNDLLGTLNASHTYYLSPKDVEYYQLASVFSFLPAIQALFDGHEIQYPTVGLLTERVEGQDFVVSVLPGGVADNAGILAGDEIVAVDGLPYHPIDSLATATKREVSFTIQRQKHGSRQTVAMMPVLLNPKLEMLEAERASIRTIPAQGKQIGYIHIYSYAGEEYHQELVSALSWGALKTCDAVIIDLREGLGGADPKYLNLFNRQIPVIISKDRAGKTYHYDPQLRKPTVYLVNHRTRSGKEILAFGAQQYDLATVIGERTAGAVLGGKLYPLSNGDLLYLAGRTSLVDGVNLEGVGVTPDIEVPRDIRYCEGRDVQIDRAVEFLRQELQS
jgi:carboxyl-terminal processing protease